MKSILITLALLVALPLTGGAQTTKKIRELTAASSLTSTDIFEVTVDPAGTPLSRKATIAQVLATLDPTILAWGGATTGADTLSYWSGTDTLSHTTLTSIARTLLANADASTMQSTLGLVIGTDVQASDSDLTSIAAMTTTSYGRGVLEIANASALRTYGGLVIGTDVQGIDSDLTAIAALTTTSYGREVLALADEAAMQSHAGLVIGTNVQAWDADLDDLSDGTLDGAKVGSGISGSNITGGSVADAYIASAATWNAKIGGSTGSTDNAIVRANGTGGGTVQGGDAVLSDTGELTLSPSNDTTGLTITGGSITGSGTTPFLSVAGTWNTTGAAKGLVVNVTQTAAGNDSAYLSVQKAGSPKFEYRNTVPTSALVYNQSHGLVLGADAAGEPFTIHKPSGFGGLQVIVATSNFIFHEGYFDLLGNHLRFNTGTRLYEDGSGIVGQRYDANPQEFRLYNTWSSSSNYEALALDWTSNVVAIKPIIGGGGGTARPAEYHTTTGGVRFMSGSGTPEGAVTAPVGSLYTRTDGGAGTTLYVKESGTGNTGWVAK